MIFFVHLSRSFYALIDIPNRARGEDYIFLLLCHFITLTRYNSIYIVFILNSFFAYNARTHVTASIYYERQKDRRD